jgi:ribosomal protein S18 acetylase RimI-like enzyme
MTIRRALPADAPDIARLVLVSAEHFLPAVFGLPFSDRLPRLTAGRGTLFSHAHALMAEVDGMVGGMLLGYSGREKAAEDPATGLALLRVLGWGMIRRLPRLLRVQGMVGILSRDEWYVSNVAVYPAFRGAGIGAALMARADEEAARSGAASVALDVETDNASAIGLYERLGFARIRETPALLLDGRRFALYRMGKPVPT